LKNPLQELQLLKYFCDMHFSKNWRSVLIIFSLVLLNIFSSNSKRVEAYYSNGIYPVIAKTFDFLLGWIPFSVGDVFYMLIIAFATYSCVQFIRGLRKTNNKWKFTLKAMQQLEFVLCFLWIWFQVAWGFNYDRESIPKRYHLDRSPVRDTEIDSFAVMMLDKVNYYAPHRGHDSSLIRKALSQNPNIRVKPSLFGIIGNYMGYSGYYNPFTGESQINTHMPPFVLPFTAAHEAAHGMGHAKESDANFIGFLNAIQSKDSSLLYSAHLEMFLFANTSVRYRDSTRSKVLYEMLAPIAKKDIETYRSFLKKYQGPIDEATTWFYTRFLRFNNQPEGMRSYDKGMVYVMRGLR
jgi:hypothetical protein